MAAAAKLEGLEARIGDASRALGEIISQFDGVQDEAEQQRLTQAGDDSVGRLNGLIRQYADEVETLPQGTRVRKTAASKVRHFTSDAKQQRKDLSRAKQRGGRAALLGGGAASRERTAAAAIDRTQNHIDDAGENLGAAVRNVREAAEMGNAGLAELEDQGGMLRDAREHAVATRGEAARAAGQLNEMTTRALTNKLLLWCIILLLLGADITCIYFGYFYKRH